MIEINEVKGHNTLKKFINFPFRLYSGNNNWVPPIIKNEFKSLKESMQKSHPKNVLFKLFLAYRNKEIVGRIALIINRKENISSKTPKIRFGWFDVVDDIAVSKALVNTITDFGKKEHLSIVEGPVGISSMDKAGMLTFGFDKLGTMTTIYNYDYYPKHLEQLGFKKGITWVEQEVMVDFDKKKKLKKLSDIVLKRYNVKVSNAKSKKDLLNKSTEMFHLINNVFSNLASFVPLNSEQIAFYKKKYAQMLNPEYICFVDDQNGKLIGFAITSPSLSKVFQKIKGRLFPFGFLHLAKASKQNDSADLHIIGIDRSYQKKGINAIIITKLFDTLQKYNIKRVEVGPILDTNIDNLNNWTRFNPKIIKKRSNFVKEL